MAATTSQASTSSPKDVKTNPQKLEEKSSKSEANEDTKNNAGTQPLAPPPKPSQNDSDYFSAGQNSNAHFSLEPNPFEQSFGNPSTETPGKFGGLPSVASLTSPAPLGTSGTPGWTNSLRSGPLSPAMLPGPTPSNGDYFDSSFRQSFPTPNESSLRSGLTPGGGGSMFPAPSPNSQAIFNSMQSGGATPGTLEFHRTAMSAAARSKNDTSTTTNNNSSGNVHGINKQEYQPAQQQQASGTQNPFNNNSEHDAVNSLYMLANNGQRNANQFAMPNQQQGGGQMQQRIGDQSQDTSPTTQRGHKQSVGNLSSATGMSENGDYGSDASGDPKSSGKKGKKGGKTNGRRKAEETTPKGSAKKSKGNDGEANDVDNTSDDELPSPGDDDDGSNMNNNGNKKLTDEEKRKNFLERNRVAALKCRQRKKQWLANLQQKVEVFTTENQELSSQNAALHEEIRSLKTLLIAHRDCPISHQQGLGGAQMANILGGDFDHHNNPYGMSMSNNGNMMMQHQQGMQRR